MLLSTSGCFVTSTLRTLHYIHCLCGHSYQSAVVPAIESRSVGSLPCSLVDDNMFAIDVRELGLDDLAVRYRNLRGRPIRWPDEIGDGERKVR